MSRNEAKNRLNMDDYKKSMEGIYSTTVAEDTLDEAPMAYKSIDDILEHLKETVDVVDILKPIYNFKAAEKKW
jgi:RNA-splicing ligase RtcB